jgi:hypothetical protein
MDQKTEALLQAWREGQWEFTLAFEDLDDDDLWKRADPKLLSVGELAGHVAYGAGQLIQDKGFSSPLLDKAFDYYLKQVDHPVVKPMTVAQVLDELKRVHEAAMAQFASVDDLSAKVPWRDDWTWGACLRYQVFHVAYHCGQAFSVRHLMGHKTNDN